MEKFYMVTGPAGKPVYAYNSKDYAAAERVAKKAASEGRDDVYILTTTGYAAAPIPDVTITAIP